MKKYHVLFCKRKSSLFFGSKLIQWAEETQYSHCEIMSMSADELTIENSMCYGSTFPKSKKSTFKEFSKKYEIVSAVPLATDGQDYDHILESMMNKHYSLVQIALTGLKIWGQGAFLWLPFVKPNLSKYLICTELVGIFLRDACKIYFDESPELLTLKEVYQLSTDKFLKKD